MHSLIHHKNLLLAFIYQVLYIGQFVNMHNYISFIYKFFASPEKFVFLQLRGFVNEPTLCENKDADQLRGFPEADQRLCFPYMDSTLPLLLKFEISLTVQPDLCRTYSGTTWLVFSRDCSILD